MRTFTIGKNDATKRLDKFIDKAAPMLPKNLMYKYIRRKRIKVNGKKSDIAFRLRECDVVDMYINDEFFEAKEDKYDFLKAPGKLDIIYEDENIMLLNKKAGVLSHPDEGEYVDTLITRVQKYLYEKGEYNPREENSFAPALANRIDRNTGGIVIAAKNAESLRILNEKIKNREMDKRYLCVVVGCPKEKKATVTAYFIICNSLLNIFQFFTYYGRNVEWYQNNLSFNFVSIKTHHTKIQHNYITDDIFCQHNIKHPFKTQNRKKHLIFRVIITYFTFFKLVLLFLLKMCYTAFWR